MTISQYKYDTEVIEFIKHDDNALQELIEQRTIEYYRHCMSPAYPALGVNVDWFSEKLLTEALNDLGDWYRQGYTVATSFSRPLYLKVQLKKPQAIIDTDLIEIAKQAKIYYIASRYEQNVAEMRRQMDITISRRAREAAVTAAKAEAEHHVSEEAFALADLLAAYAKPKGKKTEEVAA